MTKPIINSGKALRILMTRDDINRPDMAAALNCTETTISSLRKSNLISGDKLKKICVFFNISASDYFKLGE